MWLLLACTNADSADTAAETVCDVTPESDQVAFPDDEGRHESEPVQWYDWTGHLEDEAGSWYGFEQVCCFFDFGSYQSSSAHRALTNDYETHWEGAMTVSGDVTGRAYVELAGRCG